MSELPPPPDGDPPPPPPAYPSAPSYPVGGYPPAPSGYPPAPGIAPSGWYRPGPAPGVVYSGFGARFLGYLIDQILLTALLLVITIPFVIGPIVNFYRLHPVVAGHPAPTLPASVTNGFVAFGLISAVVAALYYGGLVAWQGRTLGQRVIGAHVVRIEDGGRLPVDRAFLRAIIFWGPGVIGIIPLVGQLAGLIAFIGLLSVAWDSRKQGWHDKLGRSLVVKRAAY